MARLRREAEQRLGLPPAPPPHLSVEEVLFNQLFPDSNVSSDSAAIGRNLAECERAERGLNEDSTVYGEITFSSFKRIIENIDDALGGLGYRGGGSCCGNAGNTFYDLGSGTGKAVFAAALLRGSRFKRCVGIELLRSLHEHARVLYVVDLIHISHIDTIIAE